MSVSSRHVIPNEVSVCLLECMEAFKGLEKSEKLYAHYISQASWYGGLIVNLQTSPESTGAYVMLHKLFSSMTPEKVKQLALDSGISEDDFKAIAVYTAALFSNSGNYKSFGDTKFIPNLPKENFSKLIKASGIADVQELWDEVSEDIYDLTDRRKEFGLSPKGMTTYFSSNCTLEDAEFAKDFLTSKDMSAYNTRFFKSVHQKTGKITYEVRLASVEKKGAVQGMPDDIVGSHEFSAKGHSGTVNVVKGDYSPLLLKVVDNLEKAKQYASTDEEKLMLADYIVSFRTGSMPAHMDGSRHWIKNKGPIVETYIGFIESLRDPHGMRGEFEGFAAIVNKATSAKYSELVASAEKLLPELPWPSIYEIDTFCRPDFTSLDVLAFSGSGIPAGINIPNYDEIRQNDGFKNVSLGNVISCSFKDSKLTFLSDEDKELFLKYKTAAFEVQVALHELLGHGSGKLFTQDENKKLNFDPEITMHLVTGEKITSWYKDNTTWRSVFSVISSSYEECRAECVGLYLCFLPEVLKLFGHTDNSDVVIYVNWLIMVRAGLLALEFFTPSTKSWGQAHMQARFCILRALLEAGNDLVTIKQFTADDGKPDLLISLDKSKIESVGRPAIGKLLVKLQTYKSTADFAAGKELYDYYSSVENCDGTDFLTMREIVLARKLPRRMFVQHNTRLTDGGDVELLSYEESAEGLITSVVDRFYKDDMSSVLLDLWRKDSSYFSY